MRSRKNFYSKGQKKKATKKKNEGKYEEKKENICLKQIKEFITTKGNDRMNTEIMSCSKAELFKPVTIFLDTFDDEHQFSENGLEGHNIKEKNNGKKRNKNVKIKEKNWLLHIC